MMEDGVEKGAREQKGSPRYRISRGNSRTKGTSQDNQSNVCCRQAPFFSEHARIQPRSRVPNPIAPKLAKAGIRLVLCAVHRPLRRRSLGAHAPVTAERRRAHSPGEVEPEVDRRVQHRPYCPTVFASV